MLKYWNWSLILVMLSHSIHPDFQALMLIPFATTSVVYLFQNINFFKSNINKTLAFSFWVLFLIMILGLVKSSDLGEGLKLIERNLSFLIMPIFMLPIIRLTPKEKSNLFIAFQLGIILSELLCLGNALHNTWITGSTSSLNGDPHFSYNYFMSHMLSDPFGLHPIYHSFVVLLGSVSLISYVGSRWKQINLTWRLLIPVILLLHIVLVILLKSAVFSVLYPICVSGAILFIGYKKVVRSKPLIVATGVAILILGFVGLKNSYTKIESFEIEYQLTDNHLSPLKVRFGIWSCAIPIFQENWKTGLGTANIQSALNNEYQNRQFNFILLSGLEFNTHNQYLQYGISYGILAPIIFIGILLLLLTLMIKNKNAFGIAFTICFAAFSITESTLETQRGILLFTCFASLLFYVPNYWKYGLNENSSSN